MSRLVADGILARAVRRPDVPALLWRGAVIDYAGLHALTRQVADQLDALDLHDRGPVAVRATKSPTAIALILACMRAGMPVMLASPDLGQDVLAALIVRSGCQAVLGVQHNGVQDNGVQHNGVQHNGVQGDGVQDAGEITCRPTVSGTGSAPPLPPGTSLLLTTSGSTGIPKIVPLLGEAIDRFTSWAGSTFGLGEGTRVLSHAPLNFDLSLFDIWATLKHGGCAVPVDPDLAVDPRYLVRLLEDTEPHVVQGVPMLFRLLAEAAEKSFPSVQDVLLTGDHTPQTLRAKLPALFPAATFHNVYGCTETNNSMIYSFTGPEAAQPAALPLGRPLPGVWVYVRTDGRESTDQAIGELVVSTPFQTGGYLADDRPGTRFVTVGNRTWYRTGDLVSRDHTGALTLVGRTDFQVKVRGVRVNIEEIERVILSHDAVLEAAVVAVPDPAAGTRLHAVVRAGPGLTGLGLRAYCAGRLNRAAIPATFRMTDEPLPVGPTGKVNRSHLRQELHKELT